MRSRLLGGLAVGIATIVAWSSLAGDGQVEISQSGALAGGVNGDLGEDPEGFPVRITQTGSYVLTSDLRPPEGVTAIEVEVVGPVTIDLNGFAILGRGGENAHGIFGLDQVTVRNGVITDVGGNGIELGNSARVEGVSVTRSGGGGVVTGDDSLVRECKLQENAGDELTLGARSGFQDNLIENAGTQGAAVVGGIPMGGNLCDGRPCGRACGSDADCDDGQFCNGPEVCVGQVCVPGTPPDADDGVACTDDSCDELSDAIVNTPNDSFCDNGLFCDGAEVCDATLDCQAGADPCPGQSCDESIDICL